MTSLDQYYLSYNYTSEAFVKHISNSVACCVVKSSIDLKVLNDDTLRLIVNDSFPGLSNTKRAELYSAIAVAILPIPPTKAAMDATSALAKFWDDDVKPTMALSKFSRTNVHMIVKYLVPVLQVAAVGVIIDRITTKVIAAGYSAKGSFDADKKVVTFDIGPKKDDKGANLANGVFSCASAEKVCKDTVAADENHADFQFQSGKLDIIISQSGF